MTSTVSSSPKSARSRFAINAPHSWELDTWPADVWPHETKRAEWIARAYRKDLTDAGALTRIGKTLVFMGVAYTRWLERRSKNVVEFASNNAEIGKRSAADASKLTAK